MLVHRQRGGRLEQRRRPRRVQPSPASRPRWPSTSPTTRAAARAGRSTCRSSADQAPQSATCAPRRSPRASSRCSWRRPAAARAERRRDRDRRPDGRVDARRCRARRRNRRLEGTTFANSFVSLSLCCPSRATLLTGRYAHNHGVLDIVPPLRRLREARPLARRSRCGCSAPATRPRSSASTSTTTGAATRARSRRAGPSGTGSSTRRPTRYYGYVFNDDGVLRKYGRRVPDRRDHRARRGDRSSRRAASPQPFFLWVGYLAPHNGLPREPGDPPGTPTPVARPAHAGAVRRRRRSRACPRSTRPTCATSRARSARARGCLGAADRRSIRPLPAGAGVAAGGRRGRRPRSSRRCAAAASSRTR